MIRFEENYPLKNHNTFGFDIRSKYYFEFTDPADLFVFTQSNKSWREEPILVIGEGSNLLFLDDFQGLILHPNIPGIREIREDRQNIWIEAGAGETWDEFVQYAVNYGFGGVENLSLIPGKIGAAPVQNIGAYGQEVGNCIETVKGFDLATNQPVEFSNSECEFGYRNSIFKKTLKNQVIITTVVFKLSKFPEFLLGYGDLEKRVHEKGSTNLRTIRQSVVEIRQSKLPDVREFGNAGSFFKNPEVEKTFAEKLKSEYETLPVYPVSDLKSKLAAGWLIEKAGWKGYREGDAGVHEKQALVLINYGNASGRQIFNLSQKIQQSVFEKFGVALEREVNCI